MVKLSSPGYHVNINEVTGDYVRLCIESILPGEVHTKVLSHVLHIESNL